MNFTLHGQGFYFMLAVLGRSNKEQESAMTAQVSGRQIVWVIAGMHQRAYPFYGLTLTGRNKYRGGK